MQIADPLVSTLLAQQDDKWRRARALIKIGFSASRIAELVGLPVAAAWRAKQVSDPWLQRTPSKLRMQSLERRRAWARREVPS